MSTTTDPASGTAWNARRSSCAGPFERPGTAPGREREGMERGLTVEQIAQKRPRRPRRRRYWYFTTKDVITDDGIYEAIVEATDRQEQAESEHCQPTPAAPLPPGRPQPARSDQTSALATALVLSRLRPGTSDATMAGEQRSRYRPDRPSTGHACTGRTVGDDQVQLTACAYHGRPAPPRPCAGRPTGEPSRSGPWSTKPSRPSGLSPGPPARALARLDLTRSAGTARMPRPTTTQ